MTADIAPYAPDDAPALARVLVRVRHQDVPYPPPEAGSTEDSLTAWLSAGSSLVRWVARLEGRVVGHVQLSEAHYYLTRHLAANPDRGTADLEVGRLFVDPRAHGQGVGRALLSRALQWSRERDLVAGLAVIDGSAAAQHLYASIGMRAAGRFDGIHGVNHVFVDTGVTL